MRKKIKLILVFALLGLATESCKKIGCHECHYEDENDTEVELGERCDEELEKIESEGVTVNGINYEVFCGDH